MSNKFKKIALNELNLMAREELRKLFEEDPRLKKEALSKWWQKNREKAYAKELAKKEKGTEKWVERPLEDMPDVSKDAIEKAKKMFYKGLFQQGHLDLQQWSADQDEPPSKKIKGIFDKIFTILSKTGVGSSTARRKRPINRGGPSGVKIGGLPGSYAEGVSLKEEKDYNNDQKGFQNYINDFIRYYGEWMARRGDATELLSNLRAFTEATGVKFAIGRLQTAISKKSGLDDTQTVNIDGKAQEVRSGGEGLPFADTRDDEAPELVRKGAKGLPFADAAAAEKAAAEKLGAEVAVLQQMAKNILGFSRRVQKFRGFADSAVGHKFIQLLNRLKLEISAQNWKNRENLEEAQENNTPPPSNQFTDFMALVGEIEKYLSDNKETLLRLDNEKITQRITEVESSIKTLKAIQNNQSGRTKLGFQAAAGEPEAPAAEAEPEAPAAEAEPEAPAKKPKASPLKSFGYRYEVGSRRQKFVPGSKGGRNSKQAEKERAYGRRLAKQKFKKGEVPYHNFAIGKDGEYMEEFPLMGGLKDQLKKKSPADILNYLKIMKAKLSENKDPRSKLRQIVAEELRKSLEEQK